MTIFSNLALVVIFTLSSAAAESFTDVQLLYKNLTTDRNKYMRPQKYYDDLTNVMIAFTLFHLNGIDAVSGTVSLLGYFTIIWKDENLVWLPSDYNDTQLIFMPQDQIWKPPLINSNSVKELEVFGQDGTYLELYYNGNAFWFPSERLNFICDIDITYFPFDKHICHFSVISPYGTINLTPLSTTVNTTFFGQNNEWELTGTSVSNRKSAAPEIGFYFHLKRRPLFLVMTLVIPGLMIALLNICVFLLPQGSGERIGFSITLLLAVVVFLTIAQDLLPSTAVPRLSSFCIILMMDCVMSGMIVLSNIISAWIYYKPDDEPIPERIQNVVQCGLFYHCLPTSNQVQELKENDMETEKSQDKEEYCKITWKKVAEYWDKMSFVLYLFLFITGGLFYFIDVSVSA